MDDDREEGQTWRGRRALYLLLGEEDVQARRPSSVRLLSRSKKDDMLLKTRLGNQAVESQQQPVFEGATVVCWSWCPSQVSGESPSRSANAVPGLSGRQVEGKN